MRRPVVRLTWYRCRHNWMDVTDSIALMGLFLSRVPRVPFPFSFPLSFSISVSVPVPLALTHSLVIDIPLAVMIHFHRRPPTLWWRHTGYRQAWTRFTYWW